MDYLWLVTHECPSSFEPRFRTTKCELYHTACMVYSKLLSVIDAGSMLMYSRMLSQFMDSYEFWTVKLSHIYSLSAQWHRGMMLGRTDSHYRPGWTVWQAWMRNDVRTLSLSHSPPHREMSYLFKPEMYFSSQSHSILRLFLRFATFRNFSPLCGHRTLRTQSSTLCTSHSTLRSKRDENVPQRTALHGNLTTIESRA